jgi:hypothetical protein
MHGTAGFRSATGCTQQWRLLWGKATLPLYARNSRLQDSYRMHVAVTPVMGKGHSSAQCLYARNYRLQDSYRMHVAVTPVMGKSSDQKVCRATGYFVISNSRCSSVSPDNSTRWNSLLQSAYFNTVRRLPIWMEQSRALRYTAVTNITVTYVQGQKID